MSSNHETGRASRRVVILERITVRQMILALVFIGIIGLSLDLLLEKHFESATQLIPLVVLGAGLATTMVVASNPTPAAMKAFIIVMALFVAAGVLGLVLHFKGNMEWALERTPELRGTPLIWKSLTGATPALAPGALAQLGLLGLAWSYRHPSRTGSKKMEIVE